MLVGTIDNLYAPYLSETFPTHLQLHFVYSRELIFKDNIVLDIAILFLTLQEVKTATTDFAAQTKLLLESTTMIQYNLQPTQILPQQCYIKSYYQQDSAERLIRINLYCSILHSSVEFLIYSGMLYFLSILYIVETSYQGG
ncbi:Hypothetical_protein [Hexamita inflata]|uniref:Hypothetical_protein n=1 Tax=Hexamita inflata TaxID=28002 RepID=A0ABP1IKC4_9EUKA